MNLDSNTVVITPHQEQAKMLSSNKRFILALAGVQGGKGLWEEEPVLTPTGYKKIKEIKVGDVLFDRYGKETKVKEVYVRGEQNCYRFNFNDNKSIIVDEDHLWVIIDPHKRKERILSTRDLLTTHRMYWDTTANHACIPATNPIEFKEKDLKIKPYTMGVLLGDGCLINNCRFSSVDGDIINRIKDELPTNLKVENKNGCDYLITGKRFKNIYINYLKELGLKDHKSQDKFIPDVYKFSSINQRLDLLRGLMDSDGYIKKNKEISFYSTSKRLAEDVEFLVESLGGKTKISKKKTTFTYKGIKKSGLDIYIVKINIELNPFYLKRKANKFFEFNHSREKVIKNIESVGKRKSICIKVDSPTATFIAKNQIVTHNTFGGCLWSQMRIQENPKGVGLITALSHDQLNNVVIDKFLQMFPPYRKFYRKGDKTIELPTGARIFFRSLEDPRYVEGISANWAWIDEADLVGFKGYLIIRGRVNATNGKVLMTSSIADNSWLADYLNKIDPNEMEVISWKSRDNPAFSNEEWESLKKELDPSLFRRRYEADLNFNSGLVYSRFNKNKHILDSLPKGEIVKKVFIGMDWGYVDPTAIVLIVYTESGRLYVVEEFGSESLDLDIVVAVVQKFVKMSIDKWGKNPVVFADPSNKLFLKSVESRIHHMINPNGIINNDIFDGTAKIRNLIWQNRFYILSNCKESLKEIGRYRFKEKNWERKEEPEDKFNHYMDAIRYPLASYPIYSVGYKKKEQEQDLPDFWKRRTPKYKRELERSQNDSSYFTDN